MSETQAVQRTIGGPITVQRIITDLAALGVKAGDKLLVHSSLSALGFVPGGAQAVVVALMSAVGPDGLLSAPSFTSSLSEPSHWRAPAVPADWFDTVRAQTPAFDPRLTPSRGMGAVVELLRAAPGAFRSDHPQHSLVAWGKGAEDMVGSHPIIAALGEESPIRKLYDVDAKVLFLGATYSTCSAFHLAEHRAGTIRYRKDGAPVMIDGARQWVSFDAPIYQTHLFERIGTEFERNANVSTGSVGMAHCRLFSIQAAVDFAVWWFEQHALF